MKALTVHSPWKERPILMSAPMVRAILAGKKTQTRRAIKTPAKNMQAAGMQVIKYRPPGDSWYKDHVWSMRGNSGVWGDYTHERFLELCPYGKPGDRLWVRETWYNDTCDGVKPSLMNPATARIEYRADHDCVQWEAGCPCNPDGDGKRSEWRPSILMPRWASRITLEIKGVRVERLQDITEEDAKAEGAPPLFYISGGDAWDCVTADCKLFTIFVEPSEQMKETWQVIAVKHRPAKPPPTARDAFAELWNSINGRGSWEANPYVWAISFKRLPQEAR